MSIEDLRAAWERALEKDKPRDAIAALVELEKLVPDDPQWSQRLGEAHRRNGDAPLAVEAFVRAFERYVARGFVPRALAMAKLVQTIDAARGERMERALPETTRPKGPPPLPLPKKPPPLPPAAKAAPLAPAPDAKPEEVRFSDAPDASIKISLDDLEISEVITVDVDASDVSLVPAVPPARPPNPQTKKPAEATTALRLFAVSSRDAFEALSAAAKLVEVGAAERIVKRDDPADALFAVASGHALVRIAGRPAVQLGEGEVFGEGCLLDEGRRQADVYAETALMLLRIEKSALDTLTKAHPEIDDVLFDLLARRLIMNLLHVSPLFSAFEPEARVEVAQMFEVRRAAPNTVIAERGRRSDGLYVLLSGTVTAEYADAPATRIARGTAFGHASLLGTGPSDVTIRVATEAVLVRLPATKFSALASQYPPVLAYLAEHAADRLPVSLRRP